MHISWFFCVSSISYRPTEYWLIFIKRIFQKCFWNSLSLPSRISRCPRIITVHLYEVLNIGSLSKEMHSPLFESHRNKSSHCKFHVSHGSNFSSRQLNHNEFLPDFHDCIFLKQPNYPCKCKTRFSHEMLELLYDIKGN